MTFTEQQDRAIAQKFVGALVNLAADVEKLAGIEEAGFMQRLGPALAEAGEEMLRRRVAGESFEVEEAEELIVRALERARETDTRGEAVLQ